MKYFFLIALSFCIIYCLYSYYHENNINKDNINNYLKWRYKYLTGIYRHIPNEIEQAQYKLNRNNINLIYFLSEHIGVDPFVYFGYYPKYDNNIDISDIKNWDVKNEIKFYLPKKYKIVKYNPNIDYKNYL